MEFNIEKHIEDQIQMINIEEIVRAEARTIVAKTIQQEIKELTKRKIALMINEEIELALSGEVNTDDGWGKREHYNSFEDLFKKTFAEKMANSWEVKQTISRAVKEKVEAFYKKESQTFADGFAEYLQKLKADES